MLRRVDHESDESLYGLMMNALVSEDDEGRDKLRKATENGKYVTTRGFPNWVTKKTLSSVMSALRTHVKPGEVKHLINQRSRKRKRFRK
jgi:hypothetical protein